LTSKNQLVKDFSIGKGDSDGRAQDCEHRDDEERIAELLKLEFFISSYIVVSLDLLSFHELHSDLALICFLKIPSFSHEMDTAVGERRI
jgi:hypothetical protein